MYQENSTMYVQVTDANSRIAGNVVWKQTQCWRIISYIINGFMLLTGGALLGMSIYVMVSPDATRAAVNLDTLKILVAFSSVVLLMGVMGVLGSYWAADNIVHNKCNVTLVLYQILVFILLGVTAAGVVIFFILSKNAQSLLNNQSTPESQSVSVKQPFQFNILLLVFCKTFISQVCSNFQMIHN
jgi:hypothetical protein